MTEERRSGLIEKAKNCYFKGKANGKRWEPEDALVFTLEEMDLDGKLSDETYDELRIFVGAICAKLEAESAPNWEERNPYEMLTEALFTASNNDFEKCEGLWLPKDETLVKELCECTRRVCENYRDDANDFLWENAGAALEQGKVLSLPLCFIRKRSDLPKCPLCGASIKEDTGSLSRIDNKTVICDACGTKEALEDFYGIIQG